MTYKLIDKKLQLYNDRQDIINISDFPDNLTILSNTCIGGRLYHDYHKIIIGGNQKNVIL